VRKLAIFILCLVLIFSVAGVAGADEGGRSSNAYLVRTFVDEEGRQIDEIIVPGRPPEIKAAVATVPEPNPALAVNVLSNVPAFNWSYGCSATSAAMLFGYYDNTGYSNMYAGPTDGGVCPMDNSVWGSGIAGSEGECPLSATRKWIDGRTTRGHVDDYWVESDSTSPDPFIGHWIEHAHGDCTGDYMGTNQSLLGNPDGQTTFYCDSYGDPLYDYILYEPGERDGCHGLRLFAESRGYAVVTNFSQYIKGQGSDPNKGFTFADFQSEIDAGRPVLIQVEGHTMLGYGYNTSGQTVYIQDTWDRSPHSMPWGGTYQGFEHYGVAVIQLATAAPNNPPNTPSNPSPGNHATGVSINADLSWTGSDPDIGDTLTYDVHFGTSTSPPLVSNDQSATSYDPGTLANNTKYYWKIVATDNHGAPSAGPLWDFTTNSASALPCAFDGSVTLDGDPCPGAIVEARQDSTVVRTAMVTADSMYFMVIPQASDTGLPAEGDTLNFFVDGYFGGTDTWESGETKTLNLATATAGEDNPDVATGLATILGKLELVYGFHDGYWTWYNPGWPAAQNTLDTLYMGTGYWIKVSEACILIYGANTYELDVGWNLIGWLGYQPALVDEPSVTEGLATISDKLELVYGFYGGSWTWYNPDWPANQNTLTTLYIGWGYWINVTGVCDLTYGANTYQLDAGWNLIGWLGG